MQTLRPYRVSLANASEYYSFQTKTEFLSKYNADINLLINRLQTVRQLSRRYLQESVPGSQRTVTSVEVGNSLEELVHYLFTCTSEVFIPKGSVITWISQIDNVLEVRTDNGFLRKWPPYVLVECKNWSKPVGKPEVTDFIAKMDGGNIHVGLLFARNGITGEEFTDAQGRIFAAACRERIVIVLTDSHLDRLTAGENLFDILEQEYLSVCLRAS